MSRFRMIVLLLASHALLLAAAWVYFTQPAGFRFGLPVDFHAAKSRGSPVVTNPAPVKPVAPTTITIFKTNAFHWSQMESTDYRKYIANLRSIGMPEQTIKDFIITDIMKHYALRRGELKDNGREFRFWETNEKRALTAKQLAEREKELTKIDKDVPAVLRELLGINYERELSRYFTDSREDEKRLAFLSDSKRNQILTMRDMVEEMREHLMEQFTDGKPTPAQTEKLKAINELRAGLLAQSLSPAEAELYELTTSATAERLRGQLVGFEPTADEFKMMFKLWKDFDERYAYAGPEALEKREAEQRELEKQIREKLGETRVADYERATNPGYRDLVLFTQTHELPGETAQAIFEMRTAAQNVRSQLLTNKQIQHDQRTAALKALQDEVEGSIKMTLGPKLYKSFAQGTGSWVTSLGTVR